MPQKILIIEDEQLLREAFELVLRTQGYDVIVADNGKSGLKMLRLTKPDLILLDMLMPVVSGLEFLQQAKMKEQYPNTRVIVLSNLSDSVTLENTRTLGVYRTILKADLSPTDLVATVKRSLKPAKAQV